MIPWVEVELSFEFWSYEVELFYFVFFLRTENNIHQQTFLKEIW